MKKFLSIEKSQLIKIFGCFFCAFFKITNSICIETNSACTKIKMEILGNLTVVELENRLGQRGLKQRGKKSELVKRLINAQFLGDSLMNSGMNVDQVSTDASERPDTSRPVIFENQISIPRTRVLWTQRYELVPHFNPIEETFLSAENWIK